MWLLVWLIHTGQWGVLGLCVVLAFVVHLLGWDSKPWGFEKWD